MTPHRVREIIDAYGADMNRWPAAERDAARALIAQDHQLASHLDQASRLDALLSTARPSPMPADLAQTIFADALSARPLNTNASHSASLGGRVRAFAGKFRSGQPIWQPAMGLAASLAFGVWVGTMNVVPVTGIATVTETASVSVIDDEGLSILYGDSSNLQEWVYDG